MDRRIRYKSWVAGLNYATHYHWADRVIYEIDEGNISYGMLVFATLNKQIFLLDNEVRKLISEDEYLKNWEIAFGGSSEE